MKPDPRTRTRTRTALALLTAGALALALLTPSAQAGTGSVRPECPRGLSCDWVPAAYRQTGDPADKETYGNYDTADRPRGNAVRFIVLHDTEVDYDTTLKIFQDPANQTSAHYVVRSSDGHVTQMVKNKDIAWQAGNWYLNTHSIGIEQEGVAAEGAKWYTDAMYRSTARLVRHLAARYDIPLDRQHILGHDGVPPTSAAGTPNMHWDPGPYWDWNRFMALLGRPARPSPPRSAPNEPRRGELVTVSAGFAENRQSFRDCEKGVDLPVQASSAVPLRTAPSTDAPLFSDPGLHPDGAPGTDCAADWGSKISATQQAVVADRAPGWTAIWWYGQKAWMRTPTDSRVTTPTAGQAVRPKAGRGAVPVYGVAYPEKEEYPGDFTRPTAGTPLVYTIKEGQSYPGGGAAPTGYFYAPTIDSSKPYDHTYFTGTETYVTVQIGHRVGFVRASDVDVVRTRS
ncbi:MULTISPECIES: N-acetylmuramoyl-L-alanine amidase [Streptomyces]|uniref:N-acetylmuramoyl-L-alanine amidase n=1 Tax=Streptomyces TaxID=1883 RepID=UPI00048B07F3|nr:MULTISPECIES: peptidoglycan recognition family protein [unclassified Streptomyces]MYY18747.1 N-acetylmuramoyl-L-alanine amidase [Streptomyces sp. SID4912]SCE19305.1 N-acetylmuramoyl-L-alanine amidase [Streptomyces sp. DpondAA-D4]